MFNSPVYSSIAIIYRISANVSNIPYGTRILDDIFIFLIPRRLYRSSGRDRERDDKQASPGLVANAK